MRSRELRIRRSQRRDREVVVVPGAALLTANCHMLP